MRKNWAKIVLKNRIFLTAKNKKFESIELDILLDNRLFF